MGVQRIAPADCELVVSSWNVPYYGIERDGRSQVCCAD